MTVFYCPALDITDESTTGRITLPDATVSTAQGDQVLPRPDVKRHNWNKLSDDEKASVGYFPLVEDMDIGDAPSRFHKKKSNGIAEVGGVWTRTWVWELPELDAIKANNKEANKARLETGFEYPEGSGNFYPATESDYKGLGAVVAGYSNAEARAKDALIVAGNPNPTAADVAALDQIPDDPFYFSNGSVFVVKYDPESANHFRLIGAAMSFCVTDNYAIRKADDEEAEALFDPPDPE